MYDAPKKHNSPHIHVYYQDYKASVNIANCAVMDGNFLAKQLRLVAAWIEIHREALFAHRQLGQNGEKPFSIESVTIKIYVLGRKKSHAICRLLASVNF